jgi:hypothetical protein
MSGEEPSRGALRLRQVFGVRAYSSHTLTVLAAGALLVLLTLLHQLLIKL